MTDNSVLTAARITELLAGTRNRGGHERYLRSFVASEEMFWTVNEASEYKVKCETKEGLNSLKNTLAMKAKSLQIPNVRLLKADDSTLIIVNTDKVSAEIQENEE
jgi:hypothetical protein